jgi:hypothetical protein
MAWMWLARSMNISLLWLQQLLAAQYQVLSSYLAMRTMAIASTIARILKWNDPSVPPPQSQPLSRRDRQASPETRTAPKPRVASRQTRPSWIRLLLLRSLVFLCH